MRRSSDEGICSRERVGELVKVLIRYQASYASISRPGGTSKRRMPDDQLKRIAGQLVTKTDHHPHHDAERQGLLKTMLDTDLIEVIVRRASKAWDRVLLSKFTKQEQQQEEEKEEEELKCSSSSVNITPNSPLCCSSLP